MPVPVLNKHQLESLVTQEVYDDCLGMKVLNFRPDAVISDQQPPGRVFGFINPNGEPNIVETLCFQMGDPSEGINGVTNEAVIAALIFRIEILNHQFPCPENATALRSLRTALSALENRMERVQKE